VTLWRISNYTDLTGAGGVRASGRWHTVGRPVVYLSEHPASCYLEALAHGLSAGELPRAYQWLEVDAPVGITTERVEDLSEDWFLDASATQRRGDAWFAGKASALLNVPSALVPATRNYLLNPRHPEAKQVRVVRTFRYPIDPRFESR
jgi:RES domain-containing protein